MKKVILSITAVVIAASAQAQFYAKAGIGLAIPAASQTFGFESSLTKTKVVNSSYGKGIIPFIGVGYMLNDHFGVEIAGSFLLGGTTKWEDIDSNSTDNFEESATAFNILPSILILGGNTDSKIRPYSRLGLVFTPGAKIKSIFNSKNSNSTMDRTDEYKTNAGLGFTGALGLSCRLNNMARIWVEANGCMISTTLKSGEITEYKVGGVDLLSSLTADQKAWNYENEVPKPNTTKNSIPFNTAAFSNIGLAIGVAFTFGSK